MGEKSNSTAIFEQIEGKCYFMQSHGRTYQETENFCRTVFPGNIGKVFEPTTLHINNAVLDAALAVGGVWFWIGVSNRDYKYKSNGKPLTIDPIPWDDGEPSNRFTRCVNAFPGNKLWSADFPCSTFTGNAICETTF